MPVFSKLPLLLTYLALLGWGLVGCQPSTRDRQNVAAVRLNPADVKPIVGDWLIRNLGAEPKTLHPYTSSDGYNSDINMQVYESLLTRNEKTLEIEGQLAKNWEVSEDGLTFTFTLREGITFQDGHPLTIEDVKYSFDRLMDPKTNNPHLKAVYDAFTTESAKILDERTIQFTATKLHYKNLLTIGGFEVIPQHLWDTGEDFNNHPASRHPVGTGPYKFYRWTTGKEIILERYAEWGGLNRGKVNYPERLVYRIVNEQSVLLLLLKNGALDMYNRIPPLQWSRQLSKPIWDERLNKFEYPFPGYSYLGWNHRRKPFDDPKVREALAMIVNVDNLIDKVMQGHAMRTSGFLPPAAPGYNQDVPPVPHDPERALEILKEAGWSDTDGDGILDKDGKPFQFTLMIPPISRNSVVASQYLKEDFRQVGIQMDILPLDWALMLERVKKWNFDATMMSWGLALDSDPYGIWFSEEADKPDSYNTVGYKNKKADEIMVAARQELDEDKRNAMYRELHEIIAADHPVVFMWVEKRLMAVDKRWYNINFYLPRPCFNTDEWFSPKPLWRY